MFGFTLCAEIFITIFFWGFLWKDYNSNTKYDRWDYKTVIIADHTLPIVCLLFEYIFINVVPIVRRQFVFMIVILVGYTGITMYCIAANGYLPYSGISGSSLHQLLLVVSFFGGSLLCLFLIDYITRLKLKWMGQHEILKVLNGQAEPNR